ncbi:MarR family winged helix-turn-helix transcriptional regulator [Aurantiacibacter suaedae]|uniref:MarR family winged helix-turn-helix transcriptional regulator n=1 Tax=Aurantiacibacter suaedae TaxID=2545755 RepID=UPI0010F8E488|nr:MarR family transcriptional regulator [Aurantiacibacter suaedae]
MDFGSTREHIAFQVHLTWRAARKALLSEMERGEQPVALGAYSIPMLIGLNPGITPMQLASALSLDASKVALFLRDLVGKGLVERTRSASDGRVVELRLTAAGEDFARQARAASEKLEAPFEGILSGDEKETLITLLGKLREGIA